MNKRQGWMLIVALGLMAGTAGLLGQLQAHQKLGQPGVKTIPFPGSNIKRQVVLPDHVLDYQSEAVETDKMVLDILPPDTSFGQRRYTAPDKFSISVNAVLMGTDRTSMHKPEFCLTGAGFNIDQAASGEERVHLERPQPYDLPVMKMVTTKQVELNGQRTTVKGIYVFWFVAEDCYTARHAQRMWWMMEHMLSTGVLQRWAYVSCFTLCYPGQEDATFARMKSFMTDAVPQFQLFPQAPGAVAKASPN